VQRAEHRFVFERNDTPTLSVRVGIDLVWLGRSDIT